MGAKGVLNSFVRASRTAGNELTIVSASERMTNLAEHRGVLLRLSRGTGKIRIERHSWFVRTLALASFLLCMSFCLASLAQTTGGTVSGEVTDPSKAEIPGASITITDEATGQSRRVLSNQRGLYSAPNLTPGNYDIAVSSSGFTTAFQKHVSVDVGQDVVANFHLRVGTANQSVIVAAPAPGVSLESSTLSDIVGGRRVRDLPLNGRDWTMLAALEPGVHTIDAQTAIATGSNGRGNRGWGTELTFGGSRPQQNNYRLDGISINDYSGGGPGSVLGSVLGVDAIQEFSVVTANASADYGKTSGGVVNAVTRAGSNLFHGSAYEFLRNSAFDARNFFDGPQIPPFVRNQFGGTLGGPIRRRRAFFFFNYEGLRQNLSSTNITTVPSLAARTGQLTTGPVTVDPAVAPFLNLFSLPNGPETGDTGIDSFVANADTSVDLWTGRVDDKLSNSNNLHGTFMLDNSETRGPDGTNFVVTGQLSQSRMISLEDTHIFSPNLINIARIGFSRSISEAPIKASPINPLSTDTSLGFLPSKTVGYISISGLTPFTGGIGAQPETDYHYDSYQLYDDFFYSDNLHSFKFGVALERVDSNERAVGNDPNGRFTFGSLSAFLRNQPQSFNSTIPGAAPSIYLRQTVLGLYALDDYHIRHNLTLNLGLRYEMATVPTEISNRLSSLPSLGAPTPHLGSPYFQNPTLLDISPRLGFSWEPFNDGKTAIHGGFGIYDTLPLTYQFELLAVNDAPFFKTGSITSPAKGTFPTEAFGSLTANELTYAYVQPNPGRPYVEQWNLNIQRELPATIVLNIGYTGQHGLRQPLRTSDANIVLPIQSSQGLIWPSPRGSGTRLNTKVGSINALDWASSNTYNGLNVGVLRDRNGLRLSAAYTWSKSIDNSSSSVAVTNFNNSVLGSFLFDPNVARGLSDFNVSQDLAMSFVWQVPSSRLKTGPLAWTLNGWETGGILQVASGLPFTPVIAGDPLGLLNTSPFDFPDRLNTPTCKHPVNPGNPLQYIRTDCFVPPQPGTRLGNSGRNIAIGPGISDFDASVFKNYHVDKEKLNIQFRAELFNALNHTNFSVPDRTSAQIFNQSFKPLSKAGLLKTTSTTSRQIQLAVRFTF